jgi:hypothetical protein
MQDGYWYLYSPDHPRSKHNRVKRSVLVLENKLQRYLFDNEIPHHINVIKDDDRSDNLMAMDNKEHSRLHAIVSGLGKDKKDYRKRDRLGKFIGGSYNAI